MADTAFIATDTDTKYYRVLLAVRGSVMLSQDPAQPPPGMPTDEVLKVGSMRAAQEAVKAFMARAGAAEDNWVGGDVWYGHMHLGRIRHDGQYASGARGPIANTGLDPLPPTTPPVVSANDALHALRDLLRQLTLAGVYRTGSALGLTTATAKVDFRQAERVAGDLSTKEL